MKLKDKKVDVFRTVSEKDNLGYMVERLEIYLPSIWAYFRQLSGTEKYEAAQVQQKEEVLFQVSYNANIKHTDVVRYKGILYDITRVDVFEGYKGDLTLYCKLRTKQSLE